MSGREISTALVAKIGIPKEVTKKPPGQTAGNQFEVVCQKFIRDCLIQLNHLRLGKFTVIRGPTISAFDQYSHLDELRVLADASKELKTHLGTDYLIKPDFVVIRGPETDAAINSNQELVDSNVARRTPLRHANGSLATLHASVSCKLTTKPLPTGVGRISDMTVQILKYHVIGDGTAGGREIPPTPEMLTPVSLFERRKFQLHLV